MFPEETRKGEKEEEEEERTKTCQLKRTLAKLIKKNMELSELEPDEPFENRIAGLTDTRECLSCRLQGDHAICGRLLPLDTAWIHANCLLLVEDVQVESFVVRELQSLLTKHSRTVCAECAREGGSLLTCMNSSCGLSYHVSCAKQAGCYVGEKPLVTGDQQTTAPINKKSTGSNKPLTPNFYFYCASHRRVGGVGEEPVAWEKRCLTRLVVDPDELREEMSRRKIALAQFPKHAACPRLHIGSLAVDKLGELETMSDYKTYLCPIGFSATRLFWSTKEIGRKCLYTCRIYSANQFRDRQADGLAAKAYLDKLNTQRIVVIDDDVDFRAAQQAAATAGLAQLDGQNDPPFDSSPPSNKTSTGTGSTATGTTPPGQANRGIIRMSAPNVNGAGIKLYQKLTSTPPDSTAASAKLTNQILLNNLSNQSTVLAATTSSAPEKPKVLKMGNLFS